MKATKMQKDEDGDELDDAMEDDDLILAGAGADVQDESAYNKLMMAESGVGYPGKEGES
jgi:hypothetical protein